MNRFQMITAGAGIALCILSSGTMADDSDSTAHATPLLVAEGTSFRITLDEFAATASAQSPSAQQELMNSAEKREELLEKLINMNLLAVEAERRGYDRNPEVVAVRKNRLATLMHTRLAEQIAEEEPSDEALHAFYEENYAKYNKPEKMRASHILISDKKKAQDLLNQLKKENVGLYQFRKYAREQSEDHLSAPRGGDLAFFTQNDTESEIDPKIIEAAYQIRANGGMYPQLVKTEQGYHIIMRTGYRKAIDLKFEDAKDRIKTLVQRQLHRDSVERALQALQQKYPVKLQEENLKHVVIDLTKPAAGAGAAMTRDRSIKR